MASLLSSLLLLGSINAVFGAPTARLEQRGVKPQLPFDENTTSECTWWHDQTTAVTCAAILDENLITIDQFRRWNPSIGANCNGLTTGKSYCVEAAFETVPTPTPTPSPTKPSNGIETPQPAQPDMVGNCDAFYFVKSGEGCADIAQKSGITVAQFTQWNPKAGSTCAGLWAETYACISIIGHTPTTPTPTPTKVPNGIQTPLPTQPDIVGNCDAFYFVKSGEFCADIASKSGITLAQFQQWNPKAGANCGGLWAEAYACVSIVGHTPTPTQPGNGIATPTPIQSGMVNNCNKFHFVESGQNCPAIQTKYGVSLANLFRWNPAIKADCTGMWAQTYLCVGVRA
ncbi:LysM domain-containing protein [Paraphoma chrysanthemicola]|uniref:LysM domain-containing protein n=1 Tax=Paraphoma chrysanthemicola TaxID=798071 RepID=A0A8K0RLK1_9PLEO|nr:LysM domain-containing protein [Paraphoma chrysanthemicola]